MISIQDLEDVTAYLLTSSVLLLRASPAHRRTPVPKTQKTSYTKRPHSSRQPITYEPSEIISCVGTACPTHCSAAHRALTGTPLGVGAGVGNAVGAEVGVAEGACKQTVVVVFVLISHS
mgnify:CR=1 FL=1